MGCCKSRVLSEVYLVGMEPDKYFEIRIYESHRIMFHSINMTKKQALEAFRTFVKIDTDKSGVLSLQEFCSFFGLTSNKFTDRVFGVLDADGSGELNFKEFLAGIWNYGSMTPSGIARFLFGLLDTKLTGHICAPEGEAIIRMITGRDSVPTSIRKTLKKAETKGSGSITLEAWTELAKKHRSMVASAFQVQDRIRSKFLDDNFWRNAAIFRSQVFQEAEDIMSILISAVDREAQAMNRIMREEFMKAEALEEGLIAEMEEEEEERLKQFDEASSPAVAEEARKLSEFRMLEVKAKKELQSLLDADPEPTVEKLLSHPPLVLVVREIEKLLLELPGVLFRGMEEKKARALEENSAAMWGNVEMHFKTNKKTLEAAVTERLKDYQDMIKFQGKDAAFTIITAEAFAKSKGGGLREAAAMQIKMNHFNETLEDSTNQIIDKYREMQLEMKDYYQDLFTGLLKTYCNVDDSMVDYVNIWQRRFDPITTRFTFFAPKTGVWLSTVPETGQENHDYLDLQRFHKYGIRM